jgi:probable F420-dependent oxidoreductase
MRIGFFLPQIGPVADVSTIVKVAKEAEVLKYDSLWVTERLLFPLDPQTSYYGHPLPEPYKRVFDPLETLTFVSAQTSRIALGTSVLDIPFYNPVILARRLTTLDVLSGGRLRVGFGLGWSKDEYDATGASMKVRGKRAEEFLRVLKTIWTSDPAEFHGRFFQLPKSIIQPKPIQKPHPPIYLAGYAPASLKRVVSLADGWMPVGMTVEQLKLTTSQLRSMAQASGRDPASLKIVARYNLAITEQPLAKGRPFFVGTLPQIRDDIVAVKAFGPDELIIDPTFSSDSQTVQGFLRNMEEIRKMV